MNRQNRVALIALVVMVVMVAAFAGTLPTPSNVARADGGGAGVGVMKGVFAHSDADSNLSVSFTEPEGNKPGELAFQFQVPVELVEALTIADELLERNNLRRLPADYEVERVGSKVSKFKTPTYTK